MTQRTVFLITPRARRALRIGPLLVALVACGEPPVDDTTFPPRGALHGTIVYNGPPPCTRAGHVVGAAIAFVFDETALPPPDGVGRSAAQLAVIDGDTLFASIAPTLPRLPGDALACPDPSAATVAVSAQLTVGSLRAGAYQLRGFYHRGDDFSPVLTTHQLPVAGDVAGAAISNAGDVARGASPAYTTFTLGYDANHDGVYEMPPRGALIEGVTLTLGQVLATPRPMFYWKSVVDERPLALPNGMPTPPLTRVSDPTHVVLATDERVAVAPSSDPLAADAQVLRVVYGASLPTGAEVATAAAPPYGFQVGPADQFFVSASHAQDGSVATWQGLLSPPLASLFPYAFFTKLDERDGTHQQAQAGAVVVMRGLTLGGSTFLSTLASSFVDAAGGLKSPTKSTDLTVAVLPVALCYDANDPHSDAVVVTPSLHALDGALVVDSEAARADAQRFFGTAHRNVRVIDGCLPQGIYAASLVYATGQAWTLPNETSTCVEGETSVNASPGRCVQRGTRGRTLLASQATTLVVGGERENGFCASVHAGDASYVRGVPRVCLRPDERSAR